MSSPRQKHIRAAQRHAAVPRHLCRSASSVLWLEMQITHQSVLAVWLGLSPALVWKGQVWRAVSYSLLAGGILGWAINLFWFATLISLLARDWSSRSFLGVLPCRSGRRRVAAHIDPATCRNARADRRRGDFRAAGRLGPALSPRTHPHAGDWRSVRASGGPLYRGAQRGHLLFSCGGWLFTLSMLCGGVAGWVWLALGQKRVMSRGSKVVESERVARLEL